MRRRKWRRKRRRTGEHQHAKTCGFLQKVEVRESGNS